jgi:hypothetical protein
MQQQKRLDGCIAIVTGASAVRGLVLQFVGH